MPEKQPKRPQKKPNRPGRGRPSKPDYSDLPFTSKLALSKLGRDFLHAATGPAILRRLGYSKPIPESALEDPTFADLNKISDASLHQQFAEQMSWIASLGPDSEPAHPDDHNLFLTYAFYINHLGRFPAMQELVAIRKMLEPEKKNADLEKGLRAALKKARLPYVADRALDSFKDRLGEQPGVINEPVAFWNLATETLPIYTPIERWPADLICHALVGVILGGLDDYSTALIQLWSLPEFLADLDDAASDLVSEHSIAVNGDWRQQPPDEQSLTRKQLEEYKQRLVARIMPWREEAETLCRLTYRRGSQEIPWKISEDAADWSEGHPDKSVIQHEDLPLISAILEGVEERNLQLLRQWSSGLLELEG